METIQKMFEHLIWANKRILNALHNIKDDQPDVIRLFSHILFAENVWMTRLKGQDSSHLSIWLDIDLEECDKLVQKNEETIITYLLNLKNDDLDKMVSYKTSTGEPFQNTVREILTHIAMHGHYHRGQINSQLRLLGEEPAVTDFIYYVRS
nr:DinB family protein [Lysinibacillus timonensis]